ncbi:MAG: hypothetical protein EBR30_19200 [Cytophagia bacterium]|jgi:hypothetical protein|nr:hypothetical protein [Cytophagia bacterium]
MDTKDLKALCEAYNAVYDEKLLDELEEMSDEFAGIEELSDEEIDAIVEETIDEMIAEGYDFDEVEEIFEGVLLEMNPYAPAGSKAARQYAKSTTASKRGAERSAARAATVAKVKGAVKSALGKAKSAGKAAVTKAREVGKEAKFRAVDKPAAAYATKRGLHPAAGMAARSKDPEKRRGLRAKVAADIKGRVKKKIAQAQVGAYSAARKAGQAASDVAGKAKQSAKYTATRTKRGVKKAVGAAASGIAAGASKLASRMATEEVDIFDTVLEFLQIEGIVETIEEAEWVMANLIDEEIVADILDEATYSAKSARAGKDIGKPGKAFAKIAASAGKRYGSKERGEKVAGAVLAKLRAKRG